MHITRLALDEFRCYEHFQLDVPPAGLRIPGDNASGKTSILEALLLLATTKSPRVGTESELIRWESGERYGLPPYARLQTHVVTNDAEHDLELRLETAPNGNTTRKTCVVNGRNVRAATMVGVLKVVEFSPEDVQLVTGAPADRRRQLDLLISQIDRHYMQTSSRYAKVLSQRNGLLRSFAKDGVPASAPQVGAQLAFWDEELVQHGTRIIVDRARIVARLADRMRALSSQLFADDVVDLVYVSGIPRFDRMLAEHLEDDVLHQFVAERFARELANARNDDVRRGTTTIGPQRDDTTFRINERSLAAYGSRGQQRLGVIALKLAEADIIAELTEEQPVLLLDDALSELDSNHTDFLLTTIAASSRQLFLTSATIDALDHPQLAHLQEYHLGEEPVP